MWRIFFAFDRRFRSVKENECPCEGTSCIRKNYLVCSKKTNILCEARERALRNTWQKFCHFLSVIFLSSLWMEVKSRKTGDKKEVFCAKFIDLWLWLTTCIRSLTYKLYPFRFLLHSLFIEYEFSCCKSLVHGHFFFAQNRIRHMFLNFSFNLDLPHSFHSF